MDKSEYNNSSGLSTGKVSFAEIPAPFLRLNTNDFILEANSKASELLGYKHNSIKSKLFTHFMFSNDISLYRLSKINLIENRHDQSVEIHLNTAQGNVIFVRVNLSININDEITVILTDISIQKKIENAQTFLLGYSWNDNNQDFFNELVMYLSRSLEAEFAAIYRKVSENNAESVAIFADGEFAPTSVININDTPFNSANLNVSSFINSVRYFFPNDKTIQAYQAESFTGIILRGARGKTVGYISVMSKNSIPDTSIHEMMLKQVSIRAAAEVEYLESESFFKACHNANRAMFDSKTEDELLQKVCDIIVRDCGYQLIWIGFIDDTPEKNIIPVVSSGFEQGYLQKLQISLHDKQRGNGPSATSVKTGKPVVISNMQTDPSFAPWRDEAIKRGYASSISLPLKTPDNIMGVIAIYSSLSDGFSEDNVKMLSELATFLSQGLYILRLKSKISTQ